MADSKILWNDSKSLISLINDAFSFCNTCVNFIILFYAGGVRGGG